MRAFRKITTLVLTLCIICAATIPVYAYSLSGYKWASGTITTFNSNLGTTAITAYNAGKLAWTTSSARVSFTTGTNENHNVMLAQTNDANLAWDGLFSRSGTSGTYMTYAAIILNAAQTTTWNNSGALASVAAHELGHAVGLNDLYYTAILMNGYTWGTNSRYGTWSIKTPQTDDINGANAIY